jgi:superfamily II DNA helicase RecQ
VVHWVQSASVEDYLQEFGRAGRDGRPALAVVFKRPRDIGVLEFMAERTAEEAASQGRDGSAVLEARMKRITELDAMIDSRACFRKQIRAYFEGTGPPRRRSLALRTLAWGFSRSTRS